MRPLDPYHRRVNKGFEIIFPNATKKFPKYLNESRACELFSWFSHSQPKLPTEKISSASCQNEKEIIVYWHVPNIKSKNTFSSPEFSFQNISWKIESEHLQEDISANWHGGIYLTSLPTAQQKNIKVRLDYQFSSVQPNDSTRKIPEIISHAFNMGSKRLSWGYPVESLLASDPNFFSPEAGYFQGNDMLLRVDIKLLSIIEKKESESNQLPLVRC